MKTNFNHIKVSGISIVLGENEIDFKSNPQYWNNNNEQYEKLNKIIGFNKRYKSNETTTTCDLCFEASKKLINKLNINTDEIEAIISVTQTPDYKTPGNAHILHKKLNLPKTTIALDITAGCSGYIYGLFVSYMLINSGFKKILFCAGDTLTKLVHPLDKSEMPLFGDGGSATIIEHTKENNPSFFILKSNGNGYDILYQPAGGQRLPFSDKTKIEYTDENNSTRTLENIYINGFEIFKFTLTEQPSVIKELMEYSGCSLDDIDYYFMHQANKYIVKTLIDNAKIDKEKAPFDSFSKYGNMNSASIPGAICDKFPNSIIENKKVVLHGFGVGLSWGILCTNFENVLCLKPETYKGEFNE